MQRVILLACLLGSLVLEGCNAGLAGVLAALFTDDGGGHKKGGGKQNLAAAEFVALENARLRPAQSVILLRLRNSAERGAGVQVAFSSGGGAFRPASVLPPPSGSATLGGPGSLLRLPTSAAGTLHRIPWNAFADLGDDDLHKVQLRFTGDLTGPPLFVNVLVGNDPPEIRDLAITQLEGEDVEMRVVLADTSADPIDLSLEFATEEGAEGNPFFNPARAVSGNAGLPAEPEGTSHSVRWNALSDAGPFDRPAAVRLTPFDRIGGELGKTGVPVERVLALDNNRAPEAEVIDGEVLTDPDQRRGIVLRFAVRDFEGNPVDAIVQWTTGDTPFPELGGALDSDAAARKALLQDGASQRSLQVARIGSNVIEGPVEALPAGTLLGSGAVLASWIKSLGELRGLAGACAPGGGGPGGCALQGRAVVMLPAGGGEPQLRSVCSYTPATGVLQLDAVFDPPAEPGSTLRIDLGGVEGPARLASSAGGIIHRLIWDSDADAPGGGTIRFRVTPFDRVAADAAGCTAAEGANAPGIVPGARGLAGESGGAKRLRGPFLEGDPWVVPLAPIDAPAALVAVDADGDGRMDLACAARSSSAVVLLLQRKPGVFETVRLTDSRLLGPSGLVARDLDGDGDVDLAASDDVRGGVLVLYQRPGLDFFKDRSVLAAAGALRRPAAITAADIDGDGDIDLAVAEAGGEERGVRVFFRGAGPGGCSAPEGGYSSCMLADPNGEEPHAIAGAKITGDASFDLVTAGDGFFGVYSLKILDGELTFVYTRIDAPGSDLRSVAVADLDGNGRLDLVAPDRAGRSVQIASQTSSVGFGLLAPLVSASLKGPLGIVEGDLDGNGVVDFAIADPGDPATFLGGNVCIFLGDPSGQYSSDTLERTAAPGSVSSSPQAVVIADFDGDARLDVASADDGSHQVAVFRQAGRGAFRHPAEAPARGQSLPAPASLAAADLDGDWQVDLIAANRESDSLTFFHEAGAGAFTALSIPLPPPAAPGGSEGGGSRRGPVAAVAGDLNGDGRADLVSANVDSNDLTVLLQDESGDFLAFDVRADGFLGPHSAALADLDGDGKLDLAAAARFSDDARWFRQDADGALIEAGAFRSEAGGAGPGIQGPIFVASGDMDRDGRADLVTANHRSANLTVFLRSEERGMFHPPIDVPLGTGVRPVAIAIADIDGNGILDLVSANLGRAAASILLQGEDSVLTASSIDAISGVQPTAVAGRDLDGDGKLDIALSFSGQRGSFVKVYFQGDPGSFDDGRSLRLAAAALSAPIQVLAVDLDGDGEPDLATANRLSRNVTVFYGGR